MNLQEYPFFSNLNIYFARFISKLAKNNSEELYLASALTSLWTENGNICLDLYSISGKNLAKIISDEEVNYLKDSIKCPDILTWVEKLRSSGVVGKPGDFTPLILDKRNRLYLFRYYEYEKKLAESLNKRMNLNCQDIDLEILSKGLEKYFIEDSLNDINYQKLAASIAVTKRLCIISGGPGTGKTTVIAKIIALILEQSEKSLEFALTAPTGKAAARLEESILMAKNNLLCSESVKLRMPEKAKTIHRLLGSISGSPYFRYNDKNQLPIDVVIIDEASMVDLALMSKLFQATPLSARIIILGDKDQLASVEAGSVLGDLCNISEYKKIDSQNETLNKCVVFLNKNYRFGDDKSIIRVSNAVNKGNGENAIFHMKNSTDKQVEWFDLKESDELVKILDREISHEYFSYLRADNFSDAFSFFNSFRVLCAVKNGPLGLKKINKLIEQILYKRGMIKPEGRWYHGQPILITKNDYQLNLFNGDTGIIFFDSESNGLRAFFKDSDKGFKKIILSKLPEHETVFAMTIHKSQGSEFERIILVLPDRLSPVMTRELLYTGITRAKLNVKIFGNQQAFCESARKKIERASGLLDALFE